MMAKELLTCGSMALVMACGGGTATPPSGMGGGASGGVDGAAGAPAALPSCDGACTVSFASGAEWDAYDDDPARNPAAVKLGSAQPVCLNSAAPPNCPAGALQYGVGGIAWSFSLLTVPRALWVWGPGIAPTDVADLKRFYFVHTFLLGPNPNGRISIAADDAAEVRVNGVALDQVGSVTDINEAAISNTRLTTFDMTPVLSAGQNTVTIAAQNGPSSFACNTSCTYAQNPAGVVFGGSLTYR